jgi:hypothetical protein
MSLVFRLKVLLRFRGVTLDGVLIGYWIYWHHSELQVITAPPLISSLYSLLQHPLSLFPACYVLTSRSLSTASSSGDCSASRSQVLLSQPPLQNSCKFPQSRSAKSKSHCDWRSVSKSWCRAPSGAHGQIFITLWQLRSYSSWGVLSDEGTGLSFVYAAGPCQCSLSRVRVPWDSRRYFTVSDLRLPFCRLLRLAGSRWRCSTPPPHGLAPAQQSRAQQSSSLLPATSQHGHSWHRAPLGPMAYICSVSRLLFFFSFFRCSSFDEKRGGWTFFYNWCSLTTPYYTRGHIKVGDIYILYINSFPHSTGLGSSLYSLGADPT